MPARQPTNRITATQSTFTPPAHVLGSRPFAPKSQPDITPEATSTSEKSDIQDNLDRAAIAGHHLSQLAVSPGDSAQPQTIQAKISIPNDSKQKLFGNQATGYIQQQPTPEFQTESGDISQRVDMPEDDELQMKSTRSGEISQRVDMPEDDKLQMKSTRPGKTSQRMEVPEDDKLQMKSLKSGEISQRVDMPEDDELQMKSVRSEGIFQRVDMPEEDELQMKSKSEETQQQPNDTGLPDQLKQGVEQLSGTSLDDVNVHFNSPKPSDINAHAYAQGTDIHVAPGQEQHLPHEAWHVAQQKQGRVKPTQQLAGVAINDDPSLEKEADEMGAKALQGKGLVINDEPDLESDNASFQPAIQMESYMRALNGDERVQGEVDSLKRVFTNETNRQDQVNTWVDGFAGMPTARFTGAGRHYYSPVGYKLETENESDVLANYQGDGNTNDIPVTHPSWLKAAKALRAAVMEISDYTAWASNLEDDPWGPLPEVDDKTGNGVKSSYVNYYLKPYLDSDAPEDSDQLQARNEGKSAVRAAIKNTGLTALQEHYGDPKSGKEDRFLGKGLNPEGMDEAVKDSDIPYIESILHAKFDLVTSAWYNKDAGSYSEAAAQENWHGSDDNWLANRRKSAEAISKAFNSAGADNISVEEIGPEPQNE